MYLGRRFEARKDLVVDGHRWTKLHEDGARQARKNVVAEVFIAETGIGCLIKANWGQTQGEKTREVKVTGQEMWCRASLR